MADGLRRPSPLPPGVGALGALPAAPHPAPAQTPHGPEHALAGRILRLFSAACHPDDMVALALWLRTHALALARRPPRWWLWPWVLQLWVLEAVGLPLLFAPQGAWATALVGPLDVPSWVRCGSPFAHWAGGTPALAPGMIIPGMRRG